MNPKKAAPKSAPTPGGSERPAPTAPQRALVKMSALARLSGVPAATIKHYLREGLLPAPDVKTSRNMAFYDASLVDRIRQIKDLQRTHFLPLKVIKGVLERRVSDDDDAETAAAIQRALDSMAPTDVRTRAQLIASGLAEKDLHFFESLGLVAPVERHGIVVYTGDDLALLRILGSSRKAGLTKEMLPPEIVGSYVAALREVVEIELRIFREGVVPRAGKELPRLTDAATRLSEQLVVLIRRKMLLPTLAAIVADHEKTKAQKPEKPKAQRKDSR